MGLDMYLEGRKFHWQGWGNDSPPDRMEDGKPVKEVTVDLGYWRKHPNLHGYIVQVFAGGRDECQDIGLTVANLHQILDAVRGRRLPHTEGFFFGASDQSEKAQAFDIKVFEEAIKWIEGGDLAPVILAPLVPVGAGMAMAQIKENEAAKQVAALGTPEPPRQRVSRSVVYRASW